MLPDSRRFVLTTNRLRMTEAIAEIRRAESAWPSVHYLWRLSPVVGWLNDRVLAVFGRSEAPILAGVPGLEPDEAVFVLSGLVPNRKSHPLVVFGVDPNPVAVELAEVSLWLNCIHEDGHVPWFGFQLVCGNSLVGARRQVYDSGKLGEKEKPPWRSIAVPRMKTKPRSGSR